MLKLFQGLLTVVQKSSMQMWAIKIHFFVVLVCTLKHGLILMKEVAILMNPKKAWPFNNIRDNNCLIMNWGIQIVFLSKLVQFFIVKEVSLTVHSDLFHFLVKSC